MTEQGLLEEIVRTCKGLGLNVHHCADKRAEPGFPDLVIVGSRVLFVELKNNQVQLNSTQKQLRYRLLAAGQDYRIWRPRMWAGGFIQEALKEISQ